MSPSPRFLLQRSIALYFALRRAPPHSGLFSMCVSSRGPIRCPPRPFPPASSVAGDRRGFSGGSFVGGGREDGALDYGKEVDEINLKFAEAREEIEAAMESKDTVYFNEEAQCARDAVKEALDMFNGLLARLPEKERSGLQRSMGLKMEQLKAELLQLED